MDHRASSADRDAALSRLGRLARGELSGEVSPDQASKARWRFRESLAKETSGSNAARWFGGAVAAAFVAGGLFLGYRSLVKAPLTFEVDTAEVGSHDYFLVPATSPSVHVR